MSAHVCACTCNYMRFARSRGISHGGERCTLIRPLSKKNNITICVRVHCGRSLLLRAQNVDMVQCLRCILRLFVLFRQNISSKGRADSVELYSCEAHLPPNTFYLFVNKW